MIDGVYFLLVNDKRKPDPETGLIHPYYTYRGVPYPFQAVRLSEGLKSKKRTPIEPEIAQELYRLIERENQRRIGYEQAQYEQRFAHDHGDRREAHDHAEETREEARGASKR